MFGIAGEFLEQFGEKWGRYEEEFYGIAGVLAKADEKIPNGAEKAEFIRRLPFSRPNYSKWVAVGRSVHRLSEDMRRLLPPKLSVVYAFVQLGPSDAIKFMEDRHVLFPPVKREEITRWKKRNTAKHVLNVESKSREKPRASLKPDPVVPGRFYSALKPRRSLTSNEMAALDKRLHEIAVEYDLEIAYPSVQPAKDTTEEVNAHMRREINKLIRDTLKARAEKSPARKRSILALAKELRIWPEDGEESMRYALEEINLAHEFDRIRSEAHDLYPMEGPGRPEWVDAVEGTSPTNTLSSEESEELRKIISQAATSTVGISTLTPDELRARTSDVR
jgi:hypothetical protein